MYPEHLLSPALLHFVEEREMTRPSRQEVEFKGSMRELIREILSSFRGGEGDGITRWDSKLWLGKIALSVSQ